MMLSQWLKPYLSDDELQTLESLLTDLNHSSLNISGVVTDNRDVKAGDCFIGLSGITHHGKQFVSEAVAQGAVATLLEGPSSFDKYDGFPVISLPNLKAVLNDLLIDFYKVESGLNSDNAFGMRLLAVTGTNGKSSITRFVAQMSSEMGRPTGLMGTLGFGTWPNISESKNTTPELAVLLRQFEAMRQQGSQVVAMEVSSHGIEQKRIEGLRFDSAVFSNLTQDHLDYHGNMESYFLIKRSLFLSPLLKNAIINIDDEYGQRLYADSEIKANKISYGFSDSADVRIVSWKADALSMSADITTPWGDASFIVNMLGDFNLSNVLAAIALLSVEEGASFSDVIASINNISSAPGRMQAYFKKDFASVVIDFAHTPDALESVLKTLKKQTGKKLAVVFGCGGDRDREKRPLMAVIAQQQADIVCLSSDNPRTENIDDIIQDMKSGLRGESASQILIEKDRSVAINTVVESLGEGDVVLIAGKGHEAYQDINGEKLPYSDEAVLFSMGFKPLNSALETEVGL